MTRSDGASLRAMGVAIALAAATAVGSLLAWLPPFVRNLGRIEPSSVLGGNDFAMYYAASALGRAGEWVDAYSLEGLAEAMGLRVGAASFAYPPMLAQVVSPLTSLEYATALALWFTASALIVLVLIPIVFGRAGLLSLAALGFPLYVALRFGQFVPFALAALALATLALRRGKPFVAGMALGLLAFKPQFLVGLVIVTLFDRRSWPLLRGMATTVVPMVALSLAVDPAAWRAFVTGLAETANPNVSSSWDYSMLGIIEGLPTPLLVVVYAAAVGALSWTTVRAASRMDAPEARLAFGLALSVVLSPRMVVYDWSLLVIAAAWLAPWFRSSSRARWLAVVVIAGSLSGHTASPINLGWAALAVALVGFGSIVGAERTEPEPSPV